MEKLTFYTDGSSRGNPGPGGFGVIRLSKEYVHILNTQEDDELAERTFVQTAYKEQCENTTNNREELKAVIYVLKLAKEDLSYQYEIITDSMYVVQICNDWIWKWAANGWTRAKNKPIENLDLIKELYDLLNTEFLMAEIKKCPGHAGILENELADALATNDMTKYDKLIDKNHIIEEEPLWFDKNYIEKIKKI